MSEIHETTTSEPPMTERYEQVGWWWPGDRTLNIIHPTDNHARWLAAGWQPVYVKVPEPARCPTCDSHEALRARLAEVEQALREAKEALDKTVPVLLTVKPNLDRPYPDALTLTPWTRWCEPLARRVDDARRSARAVLDKGEPDE